MGFWSGVYSKIIKGSLESIPDTWSAEFTKDLHLRSFTAIMLVNSIEIRKKNKALKWAIIQLETKFTPTAVQKVYDDFSSKSVESKTGFFAGIRLWRYQRRLRYFIKEFLYVHDIFRNYYSHTTSMISEVFRNGAKEKYTEIKDLESVLEGLYPKSDQLIFPKGEVINFRLQIKNLIDDLEKGLREEELDEKELVPRGAHPIGAGIFSRTRWKSTKGLINEELKQLVKMYGQLKFYNKILNAIREELASGVRQDLLFLLIEFFKRLDLVQKKFKIVQRDLQEIAKRLNDEVKKVHESVDKIFQLFQNDPNVKGEVAKVKNDMDALGKLISDLESINFKNTESIIAQLRKINGEESEIVTILNQKAVA